MKNAIELTEVNCDLGHGWFANWTKPVPGVGTSIYATAEVMTLRNADKGQRIDLPKESLDRLREIFKLADKQTEGPTAFDRYEIKPVVEWPDNHCEPFESLADATAAIRKFSINGKLIWSLYGHIPGQGVDCIGDFTSVQHATEIARRITGGRDDLPIHVFE